MSAIDVIRNELVCRQIVASVDNCATGPAYSVTSLSEALHTLNVNSKVLALGRRRRQFGLEVFEQNWAHVPGIRRLMYSGSLMRALESEAERGAILHTHGLWLMPNIQPAKIAARYGVPFLVSPRGMLGFEALAFSPLRKKIVWKLAQHHVLETANCIHGTSVAEYEEIRTMSLRAPVAVIPNGIHIPVGEPNPTHTILYLGRLHPKKGIDRLIEAWSRLAPEFLDWHLRIVGPSENGYRQALEKQVLRLKTPRVRFDEALLGEDKWRAFREAAVFVLPTLNENFGMVVAEALAAGTPVITTKGAPWSRVAGERCGWWMDHGVEPLEVALRDALTISSDERRAMGRRGRDWMIREFGWQGVAERMTAVYAWCLGRGSRPDFVVD